jgi:hypothetical protein
MSEAWSLPWHALQKDLASGLGTDMLGHSGRSLKAVAVQHVAVSANSWLSRAQRMMPPAQLRR